MVQSLDDALLKGLSSGDRLFFWGKKVDMALLEWARNNAVEVMTVEDGFIRSLGLGSALSRPLSLVMDRRGIYFDPTAPSDLESILENNSFTSDQLRDADKLMTEIKRLKISKYNHQTESDALNFQTKLGQNVILVPGQVDDDMSVKFGGFGMTNLSLLEAVRSARPNDYIVYKPHPDVLSKNRIGNMDDRLSLQFADSVVKKVGINSVLNCVDEVHTMTSLVGFDALIRGKTVFTYGLPFYAGWGLTEDRHKCDRRTRRLSLQELVAGALLVYPKYFHPETGKMTSAFEVLNFIASEKQALNTRVLKKIRIKVLGTLLPWVRNFIKKLVKKTG